MKEIVLNPRLIEKQGLKEKDIKEVLRLHGEREVLFDKMAALDPTKPEDVALLRLMDLQVEKIEFMLQQAWKFERNRDMHSWWFREPHCKCPIMDNMDNMGTPYRVFSDDCPIHGSDTWECEEEVPSLWSRIKRVLYALRQRHPYKS